MSKELSLSLLEIEKHLKDFVFHLEMGKVDEMFISNSFEIIEKALNALEIIKEHKLLNYVLKNEKCANMYHLSKEKCDLLKEALK